MTTSRFVLTPSVHGRSGRAAKGDILVASIIRMAREVNDSAFFLFQDGPDRIETMKNIFTMVLAAPVLGADETWWRLMQGKGSKRWWAWTLASPDAVVYRIQDSRSQEAARQVLGNYRGIVIADGYGAYDALARAGPETG